MISSQPTTSLNSSLAWRGKPEDCYQADTWMKKPRQWMPYHVFQGAIWDSGLLIKSPPTPSTDASKKNSSPANEKVEEVGTLSKVIRKQKVMSSLPSDCRCKERCYGRGNRKGEGRCCESCWKTSHGRETISEEVSSNDGKSGWSKSARIKRSEENCQSE